MNKILKIIGNHPSGINFNKLADLAADHVSRSTLERWLDIFEEYKVIERNTVRRGQRRIIKTNNQYKKWLEIQEYYEIAIGSIKRQIVALKDTSSRQKFNSVDFYEVYRLQTELMRLPFDSYVAGLKYSIHVANLLRDSAENALEPRYRELSEIVTVQAERYNFNYQEIFANLHVIMICAPYFELLKDDAKTRKKLGDLRMSMNTARKRLQNACSAIDR